MANTYNIKRDIKNNSFSNIYLLYGSEGYLKRQFREELVSALLPNPDGMNYSRITNDSGKAEESDSKLDEIISLLMTPPFFSERRVVVCENMGFAKKGNDRLNGAIESIMPSNYLIILESESKANTKTFKLVGEVGVLEECNMPDLPTLCAWTSSKVRDAGLSISREDAMYFAQSTATCMDNMDRELSKLISYAAGDGVISREHINDICIITMEEEIFNLINAIGNKNKKTALFEYQKLFLLNAQPRRILALLMQSFLKYLNVLNAVNAGKSRSFIMENLGFKKDYAIKKSLESARLFGKDTLLRFLEQGAEYRYKLNTGQLDERTGVEMYILSCLDA